MIVELHLIQNFAPSCLNRDDTNAPKDCEFGGHRRARISSQCIKRAIRKQFAADALLPAEHLARRTKRLAQAVADRLTDKPPAQVGRAVETLLGGIKLALKDGKTQYLLFLGDREVRAVTDLVRDHWDTLLGAATTPEAAPAEASEAGKPPKKQSAKHKKRAAQGTVPDAVQKALGAALDGGKAADLALFGRMLADLPDHNIDAACQVAHALSTHRVVMESDYYTAVDDLRSDDTAGADMIGTVEFNSSCFYRYANLDTTQLTANLQGDEKLARQTVAAFLEAAISAIPTGKQNSMAARNLPDAVFAVVRERGCWSLANAFEEPIRLQSDKKHEKGVVRLSVEAMDRYWGKLAAMYGADGLTAAALCTTTNADADVKHLAGYKVESVNQLVQRVADALAPAAVAEAGR